MSKCCNKHDHFWIWVFLFFLTVGSCGVKELTDLHGERLDRMEHRLRTDTTEDETEMRDSKRLQER